MGFWTRLSCAVWHFLWEVHSRKLSDFQQLSVTKLCENGLISEIHEHSIPPENLWFSKVSRGYKMRVNFWNQSDFTKNTDQKIRGNSIILTSLLISQTGQCLPVKFSLKSKWQLALLNCINKKILIYLTIFHNESALKHSLVLHELNLNLSNTV